MSLLHELQHKRRLLQDYQRSADMSEHARVAKKNATNYAHRLGLPPPQTREDIVRMLTQNIEQLENLQSKTLSDAI